MTSSKHAKGTGRERVLDAYALILREQGVAAATLEEVARKAEISKGGLLHHFASKEALVEGLLNRLLSDNENDIALAKANGPNLAAEYLHISKTATDAFSSTFLAVVKLAGSQDASVQKAIAKTSDVWLKELTEHLQNPVLARLVQLVGDGMYFNAVTGDGGARELDDQVIEIVMEYIARM